MQQPVSESSAPGPTAGMAVWVTILGFLIMTTDGYDLQSAALVAPVLTGAFKVKPEAMAPVLGASIVGMAFGSIALGWLADTAGRKRALLTCMALLSIGSLASAATPSLAALFWFRVLTGLGLGGATPIATTLTAEWTPPKWRTVAVAVVIVGVPLGGLLGAAVAATVMERFGWRAVFVLGAVLPLFFLLIALPGLPESPVFLARAAAPPAQQRRGRIFDVFAPEHLRSTLTIWGSFILNSLTLYGFVNWLPLVLRSTGMPLSAALRGSLLFNVGGVVGSVVGSILIVRYGSRIVGASMASAGAVAAVLVGVAVIADGSLHEAQLALLASITAVGVCLNAMQNFLYAVAAHSYPTDIRGSGVGWGSAVARIGGYLSSSVGGLYFALALPPAEYFYILAVFIGGTAACFFSIPTPIPGRRAQ